MRSSALSPMELVVSRNVNMVSGQALPNGDPYLQRQNEPSVAASTRNPLHLLAGANDYRTVDIPGNFEDGETGDAWLGVFKSFDGGERWQSTLLPGYPQDTSPEGMASPLKAFHAGADPVVRPGTNGLIYFAGLAFNRGEGAPSAIFVSRFVDNNNKENGDPIAYISTSIVAASNGASFLDKPWMAVDVPRKGAQVCRISTPKKAPVLLPGNNSNAASSGHAAPQAIGNITQQVLAGRMYVAYASITTTTSLTAPPVVESKIMLSRSDDCGANWTRPVQISRPEDKVNQGATIAIDPRTGTVHVAWRQFGLDVNAPDAIMSASSDASGKTFGKPRKAHAFPATRKPDQLLQKLQRGHRMGDVHELVSIKPFDSSTAETRFRTNAYPTMAIDDESRIYLAWTERGYGGRPLLPGETAAADGDARIVMSTSRAGLPWTAPTPVDSGEFAGHQLMPSMTYSGGRLLLVYYDLREDASQTFAAFVDDQQVANGRRHTIDVRALQATKADVPEFGDSTRVSEYATRTLNARGPDGRPLREQFQYNPPNLPLFQLGSVPFMGDYIDVAPAPAFVQDAGGAWIYNTANATAPVFHAVWTDNRDVQKPKSGDWKDYTPPVIAATLTTQTGGAATCQAVSSGGRNQNVYSARLTMGLVAGSPGNTKPLSSDVPRGFVVFAQNATYGTKAFRFTIENQPVGGRASFNQLGLAVAEPLLLTVDVKVAPRSMVTRTVYATSTNAKEQVRVGIQEISVENLTVVPDGLVTKVILNPDISNPDISNPDISNPDISNPDISNAEVYNPDISNPDISNPDISNPDISNPDISNPDISNIVIANPDISNPDISNPDISNPDISNPDISNPDISNAVLTDGSLTDVTWTIKNEGNTTASFNVNLFLQSATRDAAINAGIKTQLVVHKAYKTPAVDGCGVLKTQTQMVLVANVLNPEFKDFGADTTFDPANPDISNTTLWLEPGGEGKITLRIVDPDPTDAVEINPVEDVPTPVVQSESVNTENLSDPTPEPPATPAPTDPPPPPSPEMVELAYLLPFVPQNTIVDQFMAPIVVHAVAGGVAQAGVQITLAIATNPSGGHLNGVTTVLTDGNGDARFATLSAPLFIERAGVGYRLSASASAAGAMAIISAPFAIKAVPVVTTVWDETVVYDGHSHPATCSVTGLNGAALSGPVPTYSSGTAPVDVGPHSATCTFAGDALYEAASDDATLTITKAGTSAVTTGGTFTYDGAPHGSVCTVTSPSGASLTGTVIYTPGGASEPIDVDEYAVQCAFAGDANHEASSGTNTITITARAATVTAGSGTKVFGSGPDPALSPVTTSFLAADAAGITLTQSRAAGEAVASYPVTALASGGNVGNYAVTYAAGVFTITKAATTTETTGGEFAYDGAPHGSVCTVTSPSGASLTGTVTYAPGGAAAPVNVGSYGVSCVFAGDANHFPGSATATIVISNPFLVTSTADTLTLGTLRYAMTAANAAGDANTITFAISGAGPHTIALASPLPGLAYPAVIDGTTQSGWDGRPMVRVDGTGLASYGFDVQAQATIKGLAITRFTGQAGVFLGGGASGSIVELNYIGTDRGGATGLGNQLGVTLSGTTAATVRDNLISGNNLSGVLVVGGSSNEIRQNKIGTGLDGFGVLSNNDNGITLFGGADGTIIDLNVISGNGNFVGSNGWGIDIQQSGALADVTNTVITNNVIGLDASGNRIDRGGGAYVNPGPGLVSMGPVNRGNAGGGIRVFRGSGTVIGLAGAGNTISGNTKSGVQISGPAGVAPLLRGNRIGTDPTGTMERGNRRGVEVFSSSTAIIGMPGAGNGNLISGNTGDGVNAGGNTIIENNLVGVDPTESFTIGNGNAQLLVDPDGPGGNPPVVQESGCCHSGITVTAPNNIVRGNVVGGTSANTQHPGIASRGSAVGPSIIEDNFVGVNKAGTIALPNGVGVATFGAVGTIIRRNTLAHNLLAGAFLVESSQDVTLGGGNSADGNTIRNNPTGVIVGYNTGDAGRVAILSNRIYSNASLGIDLGWNGVTGNDAGDGDAGPNGQQNFPVLANASNAGATTTVDYTLDSLQINANHTIQVFASAACGARNGERLVGSFTQQTNGSGDASGNLTLSELVPVGQFLTATATDAAGNTSEFSACVAVPVPLPPATITSASPANGKPDEGFLVFRGANLPTGLGNVVAVVVNGATTANGFVLPSPSTSTAVYVRLPFGMPLGAGTVQLRNNAGTIVSNAFAIGITAVPGTPVITGILDGASNPVVAPVAAGAFIQVQADGIDTTGAVVRFVQGASTWDVTVGSVGASPAVGMVAQVNVPAAAAGGPISVSIRQGASALSAAVTITVAAPAPVLAGTAGGGGGTPFGPITCPAGSVATALRGHAGQDIDRTELWCSPVLPGPALGPAVFAGGVGGFGGADYGGTLTCAAGGVITGVHGFIRGTGWVDTLGVTCTNVITQVVTTSATVATLDGGAPFSINCPAGTEVVAIAGGQGSLLDRISIYCSNSVPPEPAPLLTQDFTRLSSMSQWGNEAKRQRRNWAMPQ